MDAVMAEQTNCVHNFLITQLSDELKGAEDYYEYAVKAKEMGDVALASMLIAHGKGELTHFADIMVAIEKSIPSIKMNPLYPLLENLEHWGQEIETDINSFR